MKTTNAGAIRTLGTALTLLAATLWAAEDESHAKHGEHGHHSNHTEDIEHKEHGEHMKHSEDSAHGTHEASDKHPWHHGAKIEAHKIGAMPNAAAFGKYVYFGGQPSADDLALMAGRGLKVVINLRTQGEIDALGYDEKAAAESHGMKYLNVPVGRDPIDGKSLKKIIALLEKAGDAPVLLHCKSSNRAGYVWSLYRGRIHGLDTKAAMTEGKSAGMTSEALAANALKQLGRGHHGK